MTFTCAHAPCSDQVSRDLLNNKISIKYCFLLLILLFMNPLNLLISSEPKITLFKLVFTIHHFVNKTKLEPHNNELWPLYLLCNVSSCRSVPTGRKKKFGWTTWIVYPIFFRPVGTDLQKVWFKVHKGDHFLHEKIRGWWGSRYFSNIVVCRSHLDVINSKQRISASKSNWQIQWNM